MTGAALPDVGLTDAPPLVDVAASMRAMTPASEPARPVTPHTVSPRSVAGGRKPRDHRAENARRRAKIAADALRAAGVRAPVVSSYPAPNASLPAAIPPASTERELRPDDLAPRAPNGQPLAQYDAGVKSLAGAIKMLGEVLALWRGAHWRVSDTPPDFDASSLARVCADAWPELLAMLGDAPQALAVMAISGMVLSRLAEDRRLAALKTPTVESSVATDDDTLGETLSGPVEGSATRRPGAGWMASRG